MFNDRTSALAHKFGIELEKPVHSFLREFDELKQDIEVVVHFGMKKLQHGVRWLQSIQNIEALPAEPRPNDCVYVEDENTSYLYDGCGWVMFAVGVDLHSKRLCTVHVDEPQWQLEGIWTCGQGEGEIWIDKSAELPGKKPKARALSSRS